MLTDEQVDEVLFEAQSLVTNRLAPALADGSLYSPDAAVIALIMMAAQIMRFRGAPVEAAANNAAMLVRMQYGDKK